MSIKDLVIRVVAGIALVVIAVWFRIRDEQTTANRVVTSVLVALGLASLLWVVGVELYYGRGPL